MKKLVVMAVFAFSFLQAQESWKTVEEVEVSGSKVSKISFVNNDMIKVVNEAPSGKNETIIDLKNDKITVINHYQKNYQIFKLSAYVDFVKNMVDGLKNGGYINPEKVEPKISYNKKKEEKVGSWNATHYTVKIDGKDYMEVWIAGEFKNSPVIKYRKKFASMLPESLEKYRSVDEKIKDHFDAEGMIVKTIKIPLNTKLPRIAQTLVTYEQAVLSPDMLAIPAGYTDTTNSAQQNTQQKVN